MQEEDNRESNEMTFLEHLEEMRWVIFKCLITLVITCGSLFFFFPYLNEFLMGPLKVVEERMGRDIVIRISSVTSPIFIIMYMILLGGFAISLPIMSYFVARFISPALNRAEKAVLIPAVLSAIGLFFIGATMTYFIILPLGIYFSSNLVTDLLGLEFLLDAEDYYSFVCFCILGIGLAFELPLLLVILIYLNVLNVEMLRQSRRWVILILVIVAAVITPPDVVTQLTLALPLYILFELALIVGGRLRNRKEKREKAQEEAEAEEERLEELEERATLTQSEDEDEEIDDFEALEKNADKANNENSFSKYAKYYAEDESYNEHIEEIEKETKNIKALEPNWNLNVPNLEPKWNLNKDSKDESNS